MMTDLAQERAALAPDEVTDPEKLPGGARGPRVVLLAPSSGFGGDGHFYGPDPGFGGPLGGSPSDAAAVAVLAFFMGVAAGLFVAAIVTSARTDT